MSSPQQVWRVYIDAWNRHDIDAILDNVTEVRGDNSRTSACIGTAPIPCGNWAASRRCRQWRSSRRCRRQPFFVVSKSVRPVGHLLSRQSSARLARTDQGEL
jgi:hypothetical protein